MKGLVTDTTRQANGTLVTVIYNHRDQEVARMEDHNLSAEEMLIAARKFRDDNPELWSDQLLVDAADEIERKHEGIFQDGLQPFDG